LINKPSPNLKMDLSIAKSC